MTILIFLKYIVEYAGCFNMQLANSFVTISQIRMTYRRWVIQNCESLGNPTLYENKGFFLVRLRAKNISNVAWNHSNCCWEKHVRFIETTNYKYFMYLYQKQSEQSVRITKLLPGSLKCWWGLKSYWSVTHNIRCNFHSVIINKNN